MGSGVDKRALDPSVYDVLLESASIAEARRPSPKGGYDVLGANRELAGAEVELVGLERRHKRLQAALATVDADYDMVLIDCPPSLSLLTLNGLACAHGVVVPMQCEYFALEGLSDLVNTIKQVHANINPALEVIGILRVMFDARITLQAQVSEQLKAHFGERVFDTVIPRNVRLAEAPSYGHARRRLRPGVERRARLHRFRPGDGGPRRRPNPARMSPAFPDDLLLRVEEASINASAPCEQLWIDGWLVRFSAGKAKRARCIQAVAPGRLPLEHRLQRCLAVYAEAGLRPYVRITPFSQPPDLDAWLAGRGMERIDDTRVMVSALPLPAGLDDDVVNADLADPPSARCRCRLRRVGRRAARVDGGRAASSRRAPAASAGAASRDLRRRPKRRCSSLAARSRSKTSWQVSTTSSPRPVRAIAAWRDALRAPALAGGGPRSSHRLSAGRRR